MSDDPVSRLLKSMSPLELLRIAPMPECEHLSSLSAETLRRRHRDKVKDLGTPPRHAGDRRPHAAREVDDRYLIGTVGATVGGAEFPNCR